MGHRLTTPDPAPICTRIVAAETQRHPGALTKWSLFGAVATWNSQGIHSHRTLSHCWIQIFRSVQAMTLLSEAPMFFTEDPEVIWILRINVTTCNGNVWELCRCKQVSSAFKHSLRPIQFPLKCSQKSDSKIFQANKASEKEPESMTVLHHTGPHCTIPYLFSCGGARSIRSQPLLGWCCSLAAYVLSQGSLPILHCDPGRYLFRTIEKIRAQSGSTKRWRCNFLQLWSEQEWS